MARARNIKPGLYLNEHLAACSIWARYLFPALWMHADREGRFEDRPIRLKAAIMPYDDCNIDVLLSELQTAGFLIRYTVENQAYVQIVNFLSHQKPHLRELPSVIPPYQKHNLGTAQAQPRRNPNTDKEQPGPADCGIPLTSSPIPIETLSGKPDIDPSSNPKINGKRAEAIEVLDFLNTKTGRRYQPVAANLEMIAARLKDGSTVVEMRQVVAKKCREWAGDEKMAEYLRPATLFNRTKFAQYQGELGNGNDN